MPTLRQLYPSYDAAVRVMNDLEAAGVPAHEIALVSGEKNAGARTGPGVSKAEMRAYAEGIKQGGTLVSVRAEDAQASRVEAILHVRSTEPDPSKFAGEALGVGAQDPGNGHAVLPVEDFPEDLPPAEQPKGAASAGAFQERVFEIRATGEEPVVSKRTRIVEEIILRRSASDRSQIVRDTLRETKLDIEDSTPPR